MSLNQLIETTATGMGYEVVFVERAAQGLLCVTIDHPNGIQVEDCERVSHQLSRVLEVEGVDYARLEISSPGLDRRLVKPEDFVRFSGQWIQLKLRTAIAKRKNFVGILQADSVDAMTLLYREDGQSSAGSSVTARAATQRKLSKVVDTPTQSLAFVFSDVDLARLVPQYDFGSKKK